jgi:sulfur-oxidizing protein SoxY
VVEETKPRKPKRLTRRALLARSAAGGAGVVAGALVAPRIARADDDETAELIRQLTGRSATESDRVRLTMPPSFSAGATVPLSFTIDSPMTVLEHVRRVRVLAPRNPLVEVASFNFVPLRSAARASTRIRLAASQHVVAVAEMSDGALLMTRTWVDVASSGCPE